MKQTNEAYYNIAGMTIRVVSDLEITPNTFRREFDSFEAEELLEDVITLYHHFAYPANMSREGTVLYNRTPWEIYETDSFYKYLMVWPDRTIKRYAEFTKDYREGHIYHESDELWKEGNLNALTTFQSDQILLAVLLADREGFYLHSAAAILAGEGYIFAGHSEAGKTTMSNMVRQHGEILCDDRNIVRKIDGKWKVYGTWSHGDLDEVLGESVPINGVYFLHQAPENRIEPMADKGKAACAVLSLVVKGITSRDWWQKTVCAAETFVKDNNFYNLYFDKSGKIVQKFM